MAHAAPYLCPVVEQRIQALQHALPGQVELIQQHPGALLQGSQQRSVAPGGTAGTLLGF